MFTGILTFLWGEIPDDPDDPDDLWGFAKWMPTALPVGSEPWGWALCKIKEGGNCHWVFSLP